MWAKIYRLLLLLILLWISACHPAEIKLSEKIIVEQQHQLIVSHHIAEYAQLEFDNYEINIAKADDRFLKEKSKPAWLQDFRQIKEEYRSAYQQGRNLYRLAVFNRNQLLNATKKNIESAADQIQIISYFTTRTDKARYARKNLIKAEISLSQSVDLYNQGQFIASEKQVRKTQNHLANAKNDINNALQRYQNMFQIEKWKRDLESTLQFSSKHKTYALTVEKLQSRLRLYYKGELIKSYQISIGSNGLDDKLYSGDRATPEGKYRITKKLRNSRYYRALVLNYPNRDDIIRFQYNKKNGILTSSTAIGGYIEIHGGGKTVPTDGCIGMDNHDIEELYNLLEIGTAVTIVGSTSYESYFKQWNGRSS